MARYQNCTHMLVGITQINSAGHRPMGLRPGQIVKLTNEEVEASKDRYRDRSKNPFDLGFIKKIPAGADQHPDAPDLGRPLKGKEAERLAEAGDLKAIEERLAEVKDQVGILVMNRATSAALEQQAITENVASEIEDLCDRRSGEVAAELKSLARNYDKLFE